MKKKVLITGGTGFIGSNIVRRLLKDNFEIHILLRNNSKTWRIEDVMHRVNIHEIELSQKNRLKILAQKINPQYIFHLSAYGNYAWQSRERKMIISNFIDLTNILEATRQIPYECFINTGSSTEYGFKNKPLSEKDSIAPESFYGATKAAGTVYCQTFAKRYEKPIVTFRLFSVYGPYEDKARFIPTLVRCSNEGIEFSVTKETIKRDFIYVDDVVSAYMKATKKNLSGEILNIGTGYQYTNNQIVNFVKEFAPSLKISSKVYPSRHWDSSNCVASIVKVKKTLDWYPKYGIREGLKQFSIWYRKNKNLYE